MKVLIFIIIGLFIYPVLIYSQVIDTTLYDGPRPGQHDTIIELSVYPSSILKVLPHYAKGKNELDTWCSQKTNYNQAMADAGINGHVYCEVIIDSVGNVGSPKIIYGQKSTYKPELVEETLRLASMLPNFIPGRYTSTTVNCSHILKFEYRKDAEQVPYHPDYVIMIYPLLY